jgi:hypothetical protein
MVAIKLTDTEAAYLVKLLEWRQRELASYKKYERVQFGILDLGPETAEMREHRQKKLATLALVESILPKAKSAVKK